MKISVETRSVEAIDGQALVLFLFEGQKDERAAAAFPEVFASGEASGKLLETTLLHQPAGFAAKRVLLVGLGKQEKATTAEWRKAAGAALRYLKSRSVGQIVYFVPTPETAEAVVEGAILGDYETDVYKSEKKDVRVVEAVAVGSTVDVAAAVERGRIIAEAQNFTRELANEPGNRLPPLQLAARAKQMAEEFGLEYEMLDQDRMQQMGMGSLLGVSIGSAEPPAFIVLRYKPAGGTTGATHLGLVGKGVTFDTGGISIKPADGMEKMKYDMSGGAAMIGAMRVLAQLKPAIPVTAFIPSVENMPGSRAQRPGDIVKSLSGKTIEVINTDAEGRLILCDAITYAKQLGCTHLVDAATLTGAVVVALGHIHAGVFSNDDALAGKFMEAAKAEGEKMWQLPVDDDYKEQYLRSAFADLPNVGGRWGGSVTAAIFLKEFADPTPWVHLDIAGTAWLEENKPYMAKGPTGITLRSCVRLAMDWKD